MVLAPLRTGGRIYALVVGPPQSWPRSRDDTGGTMWSSWSEALPFDLLLALVVSSSRSVAGHPIPRAGPHIPSLARMPEWSSSFNVPPADVEQADLHGGSDALRSGIVQMKTTTTEEYIQGRKAYHAGQGIDKDPYRGILGPWYGVGSQESAEWRRGYMDASEAHATEIEQRGGTT